MNLATTSGQSCLAAMRHALLAVLEARLYAFSRQQVRMHHKSSAFQRVKESSGVEAFDLHTAAIIN